MSDLTSKEKRELEQLFGMSGGYVLAFSNRTFDEFIFESVGLDIYSDKYKEGSGSKASRFRAFWTKEKNEIVAKLLFDLMQVVDLSNAEENFISLYNTCTKTVSRLAGDNIVEDIQHLKPNSPEREFHVLASAVRESIERNQPEVALDRLHTFVVKYLRTLCAKHQISTDKDKPLHSLMGEYVKAVKAKNIIESEMTERILKSTISILDVFNTVRNDQSLAHDNKILNYRESLLIFSHIAASIKFLETLESHSQNT